MNNKTIIGLIVIALLTGASVYVWNSRSFMTQKHIPSASNSTTQTSSSETQGAITQIETTRLSAIPSDWQTYHLRSPYINLTFKYPKSLLFKEIGTTSVGDFAGGGLSIYHDTPDTRAFLAGEDREVPLGMTITVSNTFRTPEEYIQYLGFGHADATFQGYGTTTLFGQKVYVTSGQGMDRFDIILFSHDNHLYQIIISYGMPNDEMRSMLYKVLSSFSWQN